MSAPVVLTIAGTDPTAGAGLQGDCKTIAALGGYAVSVVTAVVAQNTQGVSGYENVDRALLRAQLDAVANDTTLDAIKIGMLGNAETMNTVRIWIETLPQGIRPPIVIDPVMVATSGDALVQSDALGALKQLITVCDVVTPNTDELAVLTHQPHAVTWAQAVGQGRELADTLGVHVVVKGGHLKGATVNDALISPNSHHRVPRGAYSSVRTTVDEHTQGMNVGEAQQTRARLVHPSGITMLSKPRIPTHRTHGTGCALSSAIATKLAHQPSDLPKAFVEARSWLHHAIQQADDLAFGKGNGPIHHLAQPHDQVRSGPLTLYKDTTMHSDPLASWWDSTRRIRSNTENLSFVQELAHGTLPPEVFAQYLQQDSLYLLEYSRALAVASTLAPNLTEQRFWMQGAYNALIIERALHDNWLATNIDEPTNITAHPITVAYTRHFKTYADNQDYDGLIASLLPCYWMYQDIGHRLNATFNHLHHPYRDWLNAYSDTSFAQSTRAARAIVAHRVNQLRAENNEHTVARMYEAFVTSCQHEHNFFAMPYHCESQPSDQLTHA